uniref:Transmembrane protein 267 n=1 Tax=Lutzomyia longipalpis TaxID=7200 RepID=A0A7G3AFZ1_LUTLO
MFAKIFKLKIFLSFLLCFVCILGDYLTNRSKSRSVTKALVDNTTHGLVGLICGFILVGPFRERLTTCEAHSMLLVAYLVASGIDADHFLEARSFKLTDALNLPKRPFLHCSTIPLVIFTLLLMTLKFSKSLIACLWLSVFFLAFATHHLRDSIRRGHWFYPLGSVNPTPYPIYLIGSILLPHFMVYLISRSLHLNQSQHEEFTV